MVEIYVKLLVLDMILWCGHIPHRIHLFSSNLCDYIICMGYEKGSFPTDDVSILHYVVDYTQWAVIHILRHSTRFFVPVLVCTDHLLPCSDFVPNKVSTKIVHYAPTCIHMRFSALYFLLPWLVIVVVTDGMVLRESSIVVVVVCLCV